MADINLIRNLIKEAESLSYQDETTLDALKRKTDMIIRNIFSESSKYITDLNSIRFHPSIYPTSHDLEVSMWNGGKSELINLLNTMHDEKKLFGKSITSNEPINAKKKGLNNKSIFVIHGHNEVMKLKVSQFLEKLKLNPIILHEKYNNGRTVIEKFEDESNSAVFAIALLSGDDVGASILNKDTQSLRARQNVIFEMGYFIGKIGRKNVAALLQKDVEIPSDYEGVMYIQYSESEEWKLLLAREIKSAGINIDMNDVI